MELWLQGHVPTLSLPDCELLQLLIEFGKVLGHYNGLNGVPRDTVMRIISPIIFPSIRCDVGEEMYTVLFNPCRDESITFAIPNIDIKPCEYLWSSNTHNLSMENNYMSDKLWDESTYPFPNFNGSTVEVWEGICNFITYFATMWLLILTLHAITAVHLIFLLP